MIVIMLILLAFIYCIFTGFTFKIIEKYGKLYDNLAIFFACIGWPITLFVFIGIGIFNLLEKRYNFYQASKNFKQPINNEIYR